MRVKVYARNNYPPFVTQTWSGVVIGRFLWWYRVLVRSETFLGGHCTVKLFSRHHLFKRS